MSTDKQKEETPTFTPAPIDPNDPIIGEDVEVTPEPPPMTNEASPPMTGEESTDIPDPIPGFPGSTEVKPKP